MSEQQRAALSDLMNAQRHYIVAATKYPELNAEALQKLWCITSIVADALDLELCNADQIEQTESEVDELRRMLSL